MLAWIHANFATIVICILLLAIVTSIIAGMIRDKRQGRSSCGGCSGCAGCSKCAASTARGMR